MKLGRRTLLGSAPLLAAAAVAGCASPAGHYYRLAALPGKVLPVGLLAVGVRGIGVPAYLDQNSLIKPSGPYQFDSYNNELWAEPLGGMLQEVMVQDLAQRLPGATITASGGAITAAPDLLVEMNVLRFEPDASGLVTLSLQIAVKAGRGRALLRSSSFVQSSLAAALAAGEVQTMSQLWAAAADQVAALLVQNAAGYAGTGAAAD